MGESGHLLPELSVGPAGAAGAIHQGFAVLVRGHVAGQHLADGLAQQRGLDAPYAYEVSWGSVEVELFMMVISCGGQMARKYARAGRGGSPAKP